MEDDQCYYCLCDTSKCNDSEIYICEDVEM